jgi:SnoaL-like protein
MNAVERLWRAITHQDWKAVAAQLQPHLVVELPATGERFVGPDAYVMSHRLRPEEFTVALVQTISGEERVAVHAVITTETTTEHVVGFYDLHEARIAHAVELWTVAGATAPPRWRSG